MTPMLSCQDDACKQYCNWKPAILSLLGSFQGHGNSFHGVGGRGTRLAQLRHCLRLLLAMCSTGDEVVHQDLHEQGAIPILVGEGSLCVCFN